MRPKAKVVAAVVILVLIMLYLMWQRSKPAQVSQVDAIDRSRQFDIPVNCQLGLMLNKSSDGLLSSITIAIEPLTTDVFVNTGSLRAANLEIFDIDGNRIVHSRGEWTENISRVLPPSLFVRVRVGKKREFTIPIDARERKELQSVILNLETISYTLRTGTDYIVTYGLPMGTGYFMIQDPASGKQIPDWLFAESEGAELACSLGSSPVLLRIP